MIAAVAVLAWLIPLVFMLLAGGLAAVMFAVTRDDTPAPDEDDRPRRHDWY